jgi:hypothetical protein
VSYFHKAIDVERERLESLLAKQESRVRVAFAQFVASATDEALIKRAADLIGQGDIEGALSLLDSHIVRLSSTLPAAYTAAATSEANALAPSLAQIAPTVSISFDPTNARAAMAMRANTLAFIVAFTAKQRAATRQAISAGFVDGAGTLDVARAFRDSIGLTPNQEAAVRSYRAALVANSKSALDRALRDRRFDRTVARAADTGEPLTPEQIDNMVSRYRARSLASRAETIARTEMVKTVAQGQEEGFRQNAEAAGVPDAAVDKAWNTTEDGRERDTHHEMNGQVVGLNEAFQSPSGATLRYPGDPDAPAEEVINCRCSRTFRINSARLAELVRQAA